MERHEIVALCLRLADLAGKVQHPAVNKSNHRGDMDGSLPETINSSPI